MLLEACIDSPATTRGHVDAFIVDRSQPAIPLDFGNSRNRGSLSPPAKPVRRFTANAARADAAFEEFDLVENALRLCVRHGEFGKEFVALARSVHLENDRRSALEHRIDELTRSQLVGKNISCIWRPRPTGNAMTE